MKNSLVTVFILHALLCSLVGQNSFKVDLIDSELSKGANAVVRYDNTLVTLKSSNKLIYEVDQAVTVLNKKAVDELRFVIGYNKGSKVKDLKLEFYNSEGTLLKEVSKKDLEDWASNDGFSLITDSRLKYYQYVTSEYPVTVRRKYKVESSNTIFIPGWEPIDNYRVAVESSSYELKNNSEIELLVLEQNLAAFPAVVKKEYAYSVTRILPSRREKFSPPASDFVPSVSFVPVDFNYNGYEGHAESWGDFGNWKYNAFIANNKFTKPNLVKAELSPYLADKENQRDTIAAVYDFVQDNTRYISIQIKEGGWKPMSLDKVHHLKYGDCKALSNYTRAILDLYEIPADYVIVAANSRVKKSLNTSFATGDKGNHAILRVPRETSDDIWLECTSSSSPFNFLGSFTDDRAILVLNADTSYLTKTPSYSDKNSQTIVSTIDISRRGSSELTTSIVNYGIQYSKGYRRSQLDETERKVAIHKYLFDFIDVKEITSSDYSLDEESLESTEEYVLRTKDFAQVLGTMLSLPTKFFDLNIPNLSTKRTRVNALCFTRSKLKSVSTTYILPEGYEANITEPHTEQDNVYFYYNRSISQDGNKLKIDRVFQLKEGKHSAAEYVSIAKLFKAVRKKRTL